MIKSTVVKSRFKSSRLSLRKFNDLLTVIVIGFALYVILAPFLPKLSFWVKNQSPARTWLSSSDEVKQESEQAGNENKLFIPSLGMSETVHEGGVAELKQGVVRRSHTSTPDQGSNTVMVGHRFAYGSRGVFYHLDKVKPGDEITVHWNSQKYQYKVVKTFVVAPSETSVEAPTDSDTLTLYTCTPLWTVTDRLIVQAERINN